MYRYAVTGEKDGPCFCVDGVWFVDTLEDAADEAVAQGVTDANELSVVRAERVRLEPPCIMEQIEACFDELDFDFRGEMVDEVSDDVRSAQEMLNGAFARINARGIWRATSEEIDREHVARALHNAQFGTDT